jgi:hypothetical protein
MALIERTTGTSPGRPQDNPRTSPQDEATPPPPAERGTVYGRPPSAQDDDPVPAGHPEDDAPPPAGTRRRPRPHPEARPQARDQDIPRDDTIPGPSPRHLRRDIPPDPGWLTWAIGLAFAALSAAALVLAWDGQIKAAGRAQVPANLQFLAPGVLELLAVLLVLLGYRRGRQGSSPGVYWLAGAGVGAYAIYLTTESAPTLGAALFYGGASGAAILLTFAKFYEDLVKFQRYVLGRLPSRPPSFGVLWLTNRRLAWRSLMLAIEFDIEEIDDAKSAGRTWLVVRDDILEQLTTPAGPASIIVLPVPTGDGKRDGKARDRAIRDGRVRAEDLAVRAADAAVAELRGKPFHLPRLAEVATVAAQGRPAVPAPPAPDVLPDVPDQHRDAPDRPRRDDRDDRRQDAPDPAGRPGPHPGDDPADVPDVPTVPACGLTRDDIRAMIPADLVAAALKVSGSWDWVGELARLDTVMPGWHVMPTTPTAPQLKRAYGVGNDRGSVLRRMVEALRTTSAENAAIAAAAEQLSPAS